MFDVEAATAKISQRHGSNEFLIPPSRLSDIETKGIVPSIYRFYSLSVVYHRNMQDLLKWFGVDLNDMTKDIGTSAPPNSHVLDALANITSAKIPLCLDHDADSRKTVNFGRMVEKWGVVPVTYLQRFATREYTYGYIGSEDFTMYPILLPGSFVQIDESKCDVAHTGWGSEYERPIYFIETREGYICCWCTVGRGEIILQPHPLGPIAARILRYPQQAEVVGQVVGVAMQIDHRCPGQHFSRCATQVVMPDLRTA